MYKRKEGSEADGKIFKAKLVAKGFTQRKDVDYNEVFAPVVKYSTIWLLLSLDKLKVEKLKAQLSVEFSMKDLGLAKRILGMEIHRDVKDGSLWLAQEKYAMRPDIAYALGKVSKYNANPRKVHWEAVK
ncbi:hypothetical protein R1flu_017578 [Riccia fluitans]|uniref:Reverse transcriptase Ty1/copia-type domain-containing protein n=1 Tax=Riccia fluitans TaxID=41844 RepID=A0ABD1ZDM7_9MARC